MNMTDVLIIGAGHAGVECAFALRSNGFAGSITLVGEENELPYERPPLSKALLAGSTDPERIRLKAEALYAGSDIALTLNRKITSLDAQSRIARTADGESWRFTHCVIATGAGARSLQSPSGEGVVSIRTVADVRAMRERLVGGCRLLVVGGGYLGLEAACTAAKAGASVTVLELAASILPGRVSAYTADRLHQLHLEQGVRILTGCSIADWARVDNGWRAVTIDAQSEKQSHEADLVLVAIGATPNTAIAESAGLACNGGIVVQHDCRTSAPDVFAIGDCAAGLRPETGQHARIESVNNALVQARTVAAVITGKEPAAHRPPTFWSEQCGKRLQMAGVIVPGIACTDVGQPTARGWLVERFQDGVLRAVEAVDSPVEFMQGVKRIGSGTLSH